MSRNSIRQSDRQAMVKADKTAYYEIDLAMRTKREKEKTDRRNKVLNNFLKKVRPNMEPGVAYSLQDMLNLHSANGGSDAGMFQYLLLNEAAFLNVNHTKSMPTHVSIHSVPENCAANYDKRIDELVMQAMQFMSETGLKVTMPKRTSIKWVEALAKSAEEICNSGEAISFKNWVINRVSPWNSEATYNQRIDPADLRLLRQMGVSFTRLKSYSAFWIE